MHIDGKSNAIYVDPDTGSSQRGRHQVEMPEAVQLYGSPDQIAHIIKYEVPSLR